MEGGVCANRFVLAMRFEWLCDNCITVLVVEDYAVFSSATGSDRETTYLVRGDLAGDFDVLQEFHFCLDAGFQEGNG